MKKIILIICILLVCVLPVSAQELEVDGLSELWEQTQQHGITQGEGLEQGLSKLLGEAVGQSSTLLKRSLTTALKLLAVVMLCALAQGSLAGGEKECLQAVELAGALAITALTMTDMATMIGLGRDTIGQMDSFSKLLLPVVATLSAATGAISAAAVRQGATLLFSQLLIAIMDKLLIPMIYCYIVVNCAYAAVGNVGLKKLADFMKTAAISVLTFVLFGFVAYLTASGAVAGSVDAAAVKAAKLAISRAIPVVGSVLADASETVLAGAGVLKGTVGVAGMLVVLAICLVPFLQLSIHYVIYKATAALCATVAQPKLSNLIESIGTGFGIVLGMTGAGALVLLISLVTAISVVV